MDLDHRLPVRLVVHAAAPQADVEVPEMEREKIVCAGQIILNALHKMFEVLIVEIM